MSVVLVLVWKINLKNKLLSSPRPANVSYDELKTYLSNYEKYW